MSTPDQEQLAEERRALFQLELRERQVRLDLERREREARLVNASWRERLLMGMTLTCFLCAIGMLVAGVQTEQYYALGGSGTFGIVSSVLLRLLRAG